jgi:signal transduction histidine kinase/ligand-binding sensor domain-containing protein
MKKVKSFLMLAQVMLLTGFVFSQQPRFNKVVDGDKNGFGPVFSITQDQKGFIWFTSAIKGLQRFDGKKLTGYTHNNDNPNSLVNNLAVAVSVDSAGLIWVGTIGFGVDRLDPETKKFTHFRHDPKDPTSLGSDTVFAIMTDRSGITWVGTNLSLDKFNPVTGKFTHYQIEGLVNFVPASEEFPTINTIFEDSQGFLWIGWGDPFSGAKDGHGGLSRLDKATGKFIHYKHDAANPNSLSDNNVFSVFEDSKKTLWVCTKGKGLQSLDRSTGKFTIYGFYDPAHPERMSSPPYSGSQFDFVSFVIEDIKGGLWIGSKSAGVNKFDPGQNKTTHYGRVSNDKANLFLKDTLGGFKDSTTYRSFTARDGLLWITCESGIYTVDFTSTVIPFTLLNNPAGGFYYEEEKKNIWILTDSGMIRRNLLNNQQKQFRHDPRDVNSVSDWSVFDVKGDGEGNIWIATHNSGLDKFNTSTGQFSHIRQDKTNPASVVNDSMHVLFFDRQHFLWIGTHNGLSRMDTRTGKCTNYVNDPKDSLSIGKGHINSIIQDKNDRIWVGNDEDMFVLDSQTGKFKRYKIGSGALAILCVDQDGVLWAANTSGLYFFDKQKDRFKIFTTQIFPDGVDGISGIAEDVRGNLWVSTTSSILRISKERNMVRIYGAAQGVQPATATWMKNIRINDGRLFLGGTKGYYSFNPDELQDERTAPIINFTSFKIRSEEVVAGPGSPLKQPIWKTNEVRLNYSQNTFSFEFGAIDYKNGGDIKYLCKLENYDIEWRDIGTEPKATYFNLPAGKYNLQVKAINSDGSMAEKSIAISIAPPWWKTWWAYGLYGLLVIIAGYLIYKYQKYYIVKRERERTQQKELAQAKEIEKAYTQLKSTQAQLIQSEKMASLGELTAGIAHEIQNPLNFVNNFSEVNTELISELVEEVDKGNTAEVKSIAADIKENSEKIVHHGRRADAIVKGMLQHSRSSSNQKEPTDINALADEYLRLAYHGLRAKDKSFNATMHTDYDKGIGNIQVVPQDIGRVILNLITNAFYACTERSRSAVNELKALRQAQGDNNYEPLVSVSTRKLVGKVEIKVTDNGNGIPQKVLDKVFQPFFTTKPAGQGTGLGLSLSYDIVKAHGGEIKLETKEGEGTTFIIQLPDSLS